MAEFGPEFHWLFEVQVVYSFAPLCVAMFVGLLSYENVHPVYKSFKVLSLVS